MKKMRRMVAGLLAIGMAFALHTAWRQKIVDLRW